MALATLASALTVLVGPQLATAGYGVQPIGTAIPVTTSSAGAVVTPERIDFLVYLDERDSGYTVWVSDSPAIGVAGTPAGAALGWCDSSGLRPWVEPGKFVCSTSTAPLKPGRTYYWWLDYRRQEEGAATPQKALSGPFSFTLAQSSAPVTSPQAPATTPTVRQSTKTYRSAPSLPSASRYEGDRSIKHARLTSVIYKTMKALGAPRTLAVGCWSEFDFDAVAESAEFVTHDGDIRLAGFWLGRQPRWLHLAPTVCASIQELLDTKRPSARRAFGLTVALHETIHAYGIDNEAQTNCFAVQLVPVAASFVGLTRAAGDYLRRLAFNITRRSAPAGYWDGSRCRDDGVWDLLPKVANLG
ncbi:MAG: hypothetical protein H0V45_07850 [Actinobacteria bacterium]|nr:hypothetical protein [Actinomycetota bacterium]